MVEQLLKKEIKELKFEDQTELEKQKFEKSVANLQKIISQELAEI